MNDQLRKIIKNHGHFPTDAAVVKLLWLATRDIKDKPARERATQASQPTGPGQTVTQDRKPALSALLTASPDQLDHYIN